MALENIRMKNAPYLAAGIKGMPWVSFINGSGQTRRLSAAEWNYRAKHTAAKSRAAPNNSLLPRGKLHVSGIEIRLAWLWLCQECGIRCFRGLMNAVRIFVKSSKYLTLLIEKLLRRNSLFYGVMAAEDHVNIQQSVVTDTPLSQD